MEVKYFFGINNEKIGPLDERAIRQYIDQGAIAKNTLAWCSGMNGWQSVVDIPELKSAFGDLLLKQAIPPPLPAAETAQSSSQSAGIPAGLSQLETSCYKFAMWCYRPMGKWKSPIGKMVVDNPKKAVPVAFGTVIAMVFIIFLLLSSFSQTGSSTGGSRQADVSQAQQPAGDWRAQYQAIRGAQQYTQDAIDDSYRYKRASEDRRDETYRRATYDWYRDND